MDGGKQAPHSHVQGQKKKWEAWVICTRHPVHVACYVFFWPTYLPTFAGTIGRPRTFAMNTNKCKSLKFRVAKASTLLRNLQPVVFPRCKIKERNKERGKEMGHYQVSETCLEGEGRVEEESWHGTCGLRVSGNQRFRSRPRSGNGQKGDRSRRKKEKKKERKKERKWKMTEWMDGWMSSLVLVSSALLREMMKPQSGLFLFRWTRLWNR